MPLHAITVALLLSALPGAAQTTYVKTEGQWLRQESGREFLVHPTVITVKLPRSVSVVERLAGLEVARGAVVLRSNGIGFHDLRIPAEKDVMAFVEELRASGAFELVEENTLGTYGGGLPNDPDFASLWNLHNTGQTGGAPDADVDAIEAWEIEDGDPSVVVAVLDSGTEWYHRDLAANIWSNPGELLDGADTDGNGFVDDVRGWNFSGATNDPSGSFFHGTAVASVVAASGQNATGIVGLAGGGADGIGAKIMALNVGNLFPDGSILDEAILYAAENGADVITLSLSVGSSAAIDAAVDVAHDTYGVFIDCAAGNNGSSVNYPGSLPKIMAVASTNDSDQVSSFSNPGPEVEVAAPGEDIFMCDLNNDYLTNSGTSFSSPHVAGLAALLISRRPSLTNVQVRQIMIDTADDVAAPGNDNDSGAGRINARAALESLSTGGPNSGGSAVLPLGSASIIVTVPPVPRLGGRLPVEASSAPPGALAVLGLGTHALAHPRYGFVLGEATWIPTRIDTGGEARITFDLPEDMAFLGQERLVQWFAADPASSAGVATSKVQRLRLHAARGTR